MHTHKPTVLITGCSSFLGAHTLLHLEKRCSVIGLYHTTKPTFTQSRIIQTDLTQDSAIDDISTLEFDWIIHLAGKIQSTSEQTAMSINRKMLDTVLKMEKPIVYASSTAVHWEQDIPYVQIRREDEQRIVDTGIPHAILRPCAPYGPKIPGYTPKHKESFQTLVDAIRYAPFVPVIGNGQYMRQPIHATDFAELIWHCISNTETNMTFDAAGASAHTFDTIIQILQAKLHRKRPIVHIPKRLAVLASSLIGNLEPSLVGAMDNSEAFDVEEIKSRIPLRDFETGCWDLLFNT